MTILREARDGDLKAIMALDDDAFGSPLEGHLIAALLRDGNTILHLVAETDGALEGHIAFSRLAADDGALAASALAPLAVHPARQGQGLGGRLVRTGLDALRAAGEDVVLVLGDPALYGRFGFSAEAARAFTTAFDGPHLQALSLSPRGRAAHGRLVYPPIFLTLT